MGGQFMNGIIFNLFRLFIVNTYDYIGWSKIQEIAMNKKNGEKGTEKDFFYLLSIATDILGEEEMDMLQKFGKYCFIHLLENSLLEKKKVVEKEINLFLYSDDLINLKIKKLNERDQFGWEIDGMLKFTNEGLFKKEKSIFCEFINGFLAEGDRYYDHSISLAHMKNTVMTYDSCKIRVFVNS